MCPLALWANPSAAREAFLQRNPEIRDSISVLALTSPEREKLATEETYFHIRTIWRHLLESGNTRVGKTAAEQKERADEMMNAEMAYHQNLDEYLKEGAYLFAIRTEGSIPIHGFLVLSDKDTVFRSIMTGDASAIK